MLHASIDNFSHAVFWLAVLQIFFVNVLLSGDNAVVIAMACRGLPPTQRSWGMILGAGVAVILRIVFAAVVTELMLLPYLKLLGGIALLYIAAKLLVPEGAERSEVQSGTHLWRVAWIVVVADIVMSLDNVIALAAIAKGSFLLLGIGLAISIPLTIAGAALVMALLDKFPILIWAGAALLGWIAGKVIATDPAVVHLLISAFGEKLAHQAELAAAGSGLFVVIAIGGLLRQLHISGMRTGIRAGAGKEKATRGA